jgi:hypothetical protein
MFGRPSKWEINALVIISAQLKSIQRGLAVLLAAAGNVPPEQLAKLTQETKELEARSKALDEAIEKQKTKKG